ncbi:MCE family protein [Bizionia argentinensis JUB59]|uniref:MCE family protein n=1 Tax=Bizionia argentinensis JUB59 TaxID=1046627 RepID=G2EAQ0_9FLAO|nr:MlaD family protein [Bizionia argentinensis]EGV44503.1 MCE family protein [Bizionia argentinensis JUB59]
MGKSNAQKIKVGIFVVVGTLLLIAALYFIGSKQQMFSKNIEIYATFSNVNGLTLGNNVRYSGVNIGTVSNIEMVNEGNIRVQMIVEEKTSKFIKKDAIASISSDGLVGSMVVNIVPGKDETARQVVSGDTIQISSKASTDEMLSTLNKTNENAALLTADLLKITNQIVEGKGTLGALVSDSLMGKDIRQSAEELRKMTSGATLAINKINTIISKINYDESAAALLLSDTVSKNKIEKVFVNLEKSSDHINAVTKNLDEYIMEMKSGKGALNHITQDEGFVKNIDSTMINIKEAAEKLNENMEALKHNFFFRGYFRKQEKQKKKEAENN